jgi:hypothetical protein
MVSPIGRLLVVILIFFTSLPLAALDFEKEIHRNERQVKVTYKRPPKQMSHFLRHYSLCNRHFGNERTLCNVNEAKRQYAAYRQEWDERQREVAMTTGEFQIQLERKDK